MSGWRRSRRGRSCSRMWSELESVLSRTSKTRYTKLCVGIDRVNRFNCAHGRRS